VELETAVIMAGLSTSSVVISHPLRGLKEPNAQALRLKKIVLCCRNRSEMRIAMRAGKLQTVGFCGFCI
jgi:hypothetical protein